MQYIPFQEWQITAGTERLLLINHDICLCPALAKSALVNGNSALWEEVEWVLLWSVLLMPLNYISQSEHEGFFQFFSLFRYFKINFLPQSLLISVFAAHCCNFLRLLRHLFLSAEVFAKKTLKSINKLVFFSGVWMNRNQYEALGKKFSPRAEFRLLRCLPVIIFPLAAPGSPGDNITVRNPHKRGSTFPDSC